MEITIEHRNKIEEIIGNLECSKAFECYTSGFENLCSVKVVAGGRFIECMNEHAHWCKHSMSFGYSLFCQCPLRIYTARNFGK